MEQTIIATLNIRGANRKGPALHNFINKNNIDIILLQETNFKTLKQAHHFCYTLGITLAAHSVAQQHSRGTSILCTIDKYTLSNIAANTHGSFT